MSEYIAGANTRYQAFRTAANILTTTASIYAGNKYARQALPKDIILNLKSKPRKTEYSKALVRSIKNRDAYGRYFSKKYPNNGRQVSTSTKMPKGRYKRRGRATRRPRRRVRRTKASYSMRARTSNSRRYARKKNLGVGVPPRLSGILKSFVRSNDITSVGAKLRIGVINLVDMNNDQRTGAGADDEGSSHWIEGTAGATQAQYTTPMYFDTIKSLYTQYYITKIDTHITFYNLHGLVESDITIAYKTFKPHDDEAEAAFNSSSAEAIVCQDRLKRFKLGPANAARTGRTQKTIKLSWKPKNWIPARVWFSEQSDLGVGEKTFTSTGVFTHELMSHVPRTVFWAWFTRDGAPPDDSSIGVEQITYYHYTAFGRKLVSVS